MIEQWFALQIRHRFEFVCDRLLRAKGYETFLPLDLLPGRSGHPKPLLPGYLFCQITDTSVGRIVTTPGIVKILGACGKHIPVDTEEIQNLRVVEQSGMVRYQLKTAPTPSVQVQIVSGPLKGLCGLLLSDHKSRRLVVSVTLLQRAVAAELDESTVVQVMTKRNGSSPSEFARDSVFRKRMAGHF